MKEITIFAKKRTTAQGKVFYNYITTLAKKNGEEITVGVKFKETAGAPKPEECPINIQVTKENLNLAKRKYKREDTGELVDSFTLWVNEWKKGTKYIDKSLDDFDI